MDWFEDPLINEIDETSTEKKSVRDQGVEQLPSFDLSASDGEIHSEVNDEAVIKLAHEQEINSSSLNLGEEEKLLPLNHNMSAVGDAPMEEVEQINGTNDERHGLVDHEHDSEQNTELLEQRSTLTLDNDQVHLAQSEQQKLAETTDMEPEMTPQLLDSPLNGTDTESHTLNGLTSVENTFQNPQNTVKRPPPSSSDVIDLVDDDDDNDSDDIKLLQPVFMKRPKVTNDPVQITRSQNLVQHNNPIPSNAAVASYEGRNAMMSGWISQLNSTEQTNLNGAMAESSTVFKNNSSYRTNVPRLPLQFDIPTFLSYPWGFRPTWASMIPTNQQQMIEVQPAAVSMPKNIERRWRHFRLSLLNVNEFTIIGASADDTAGLGVSIRKISRGHGKAVFQRDKDNEFGGKWRIPLGAYQAFFTFLKSDQFTTVEGIPQDQLKVASLEKARQDKGYPEARELINKNVPEGIANALAPFQRGGVDFVLSKFGRAMIADDMGLGKTIQGIASMSAYHSEWPLLVLCPSGARYHWENEFRNWLGTRSPVNKNITSRAAKEALLLDKEIHVIQNSKDPVLPRKNIRVAICSYGLAPTLIIAEKLTPGMFRCAIVDESHMLKNKTSKRTSTLLPILQQMDRCVLLTGTPALARPAELWPQLSILNPRKGGYWNNENDYMEKYVRNISSQRSAELNTMLRATVMTRRLKSDMMKTLPRKLREKAEVSVVSNEQREEFHDLLLQLRESKGQLGKLARKHFADNDRNYDDEIDEMGAKVDVSMATRAMMYDEARQNLDHDIRHKYQEGQERIQASLMMLSQGLTREQRDDAERQMRTALHEQLEAEYTSRFHSLKEEFQDVALKEQMEQKSENKRTTLLSRLYSLTGDAKIPLIVDMLKRWLIDPTKGKLCIFAHHISVLDALQEQAGLSNASNSKRKFIRIDGSTLPKQRQEQINDFQSNPEVRIALLGITAAGVAVTLTASSTVWFAELFWTPAIMIQAEDRCHRIGQQAQVRCLYFVAKGTLDDVLWKLIEKKFQDLGEFVEGKEKLKLVVDNVYHGIKQVHEMFSNADDDEEIDELEDNLDELDKVALLDDLECEIQELGEEEARMLNLNDGEENETQEDSKISAIDEEETLGKSQDDAIALSDDEDENEDHSSSNGCELKGTKQSQSATDDSLFSELIGIGIQAPVVMNRPLNDCRPYRIHVGEKRLGIEIAFFKNRVIVGKICKDRLDRLGLNSKPGVGEVLVAINGNNIPLVQSMDSVARSLQLAMQRPPVELVFVEIPLFAARYKQYLAEKLNKFKMQQTANTSVSKSVAQHSSVIDLLDDD